MNKFQSISHVPMEPSVRKYLSKSPKYPEGEEVKGPSSKSDNIQALSKNEMKQLSTLERHSPKLSSTQKLSISKGKQKQILLLDSWTTVKVTPDEAKKFQQSLGVGSRLQFQQGELGKLLKMNLFEMKDSELTNGNILSSGEMNAIRLFTVEHYLLINGTLDRDQTSLNMWLEYTEKLFDEPFDDKKRNQILTEAQTHVNEIARMMASGINKLPEYEGQIYRGDAMTSEQLDEWRKGKLMMTSKFFSCSTDVGIGEKFARQSAIDYMKDTGVPYKPVLYVFKSENSKDISKYSVTQKENERIYTPGQAFRSVEVDEKTVPGLAIIFLEEIAKSPSGN